MGNTLKLHGIVLHAYDIGEADRFCLVLTKEKGLIPMRARGVRKLCSRMGGNMLPLHELKITAHEGSSGITMQDAAPIGKNNTLNFVAYLCAGQCADTLLVMLEDNHPVSEVFSLMQKYLNGCRHGTVTSALPFIVRLLFELGLLPMQENHRIFLHLSEDERNFLKEVQTNQNWMELKTPGTCNTLNAMCESIIKEHSKRPLKASIVAQNCQ